jgi:predicted acyl esterase
MHVTRHPCEIADGMQIEWDVPIEMDDGVVLRADVFRPLAAGHYQGVGCHLGEAIRARSTAADAGRVRPARIRHRDLV